MTEGTALLGCSMQDDPSHATLTTRGAALQTLYSNRGRFGIHVRPEIRWTAFHRLVSLGNLPLYGVHGAHARCFDKHLRPLATAIRHAPTANVHQFGMIGFLLMETR